MGRISSAEPAPDVGPARWPLLGVNRVIAGDLVWPKTITPILLPSRSPELNPVETIWRHLRANHLSNRVFETCDEIIDAACEAWRRLTERPDVITSIGMRQWAHTGRV